MSQPVTHSDEVRLVLPAGLTATSCAAMATEFTFHLGGHEPEYLLQAATEAFHEIERLEESLSFYREASDVTRINRAPAGAEVRVSADTMNCLLQAAEATQLTQGAFDAFTGRAASDAKRQTVPLHLRDAPGPSGEDLPGPVISLAPTDSLVRKLRAGPWLDLGAIGKGYSLDVAAAWLKEWGVTVGLLSAGGSSYRGLGGPEWILEPAAGGRRTLPGEFCLGASGGRFQAGHIIDARATGAGTGTIRALTLAPSAALADALSTAAMLLSPVEISALARRVPGTAFLLINASGRAWGSGAPFA
jgi:thiamine biosynthesis lipoprotein